MFNTIVHADSLNNEDPRVTSILEKLRLEEYSSKFVEARIDYATFLTLNDDELRELKLPLGVRKRIAKEIKLLQKMEFTKGK